MEKHTRTRNGLRLFTTVLAAFVFPGIDEICSKARADSTALYFHLPRTPFSDVLADGTDAFEFVPTTNILVTALGWYDHDGDGLWLNHQVGIFETASQTLVAPTTIITSSSLLDPSTHFRFNAVPAFLLCEGVSYTVAGYADGPPFDPYVAGTEGSFVFGNEIDFVRYRFDLGPGFCFPTSYGTPENTMELLLGPNFQYVAVPEPGAVMFGLLALSCVFALKWYRGRK